MSTGGTSGLCDQSSHTQDVSSWGRVRLTFCLIGSQPASQLASCNWPTNQPCDRISTCQVLAWSDGGRRTGSPVQGPSSSTGSPWGVTYLTKARQVTQMSSVAHYIPLAISSGTICSFVSTSPNHIFLLEMYRNVIWTMFYPGQFTHIHPPSICCIYTPRYYFQGTTLIITNWKCYGKTSDHRSVCPNKLVPHLATRCL